MGMQHVQHGHCEPSPRFRCRLGMTHGTTVIWWEAKAAYQRETPAIEDSLKPEKIKVKDSGLSHHHSPLLFQGRRQRSIHNAVKESKKGQGGECCPTGIISPEGGSLRSWD